MLPFGHPASASWTEGAAGGVCLKTCPKTTCLPGRIQYRTLWLEMIIPQPGTDQMIFPQVVEVLTLLESVSWVAFCRQCYLPGSACRCLESCSTASTASTTGPLWSDIADPTCWHQPGTGWERRRIGASIWIFSHGRRLHLGSALYGFPRAPWSSFCHSPAMPPCWEGFSSGKPTHGHPVWTDCTARSPETSSADLGAAYYTEPPTGSAASAST